MISVQFNWKLSPVWLPAGTTQFGGRGSLGTTSGVKKGITHGSLLTAPVEVVMVSVPVTTLPS